MKPKPSLFSTTNFLTRPFVQDDQTHDEAVKLSGYGVELQIKSTEYKAQDDAKLEDSEQSGDKASGVGKRKDEVKGFNFDMLKSRYSEQQEKLDKLKEFRQHLIDQSYAMAPLKVRNVAFQRTQKSLIIRLCSAFVGLGVTRLESSSCCSHHESPRNSVGCPRGDIPELSVPCPFPFKRQR